MYYPYTILYMFCWVQLPVLHSTDISNLSEIHIFRMFCPSIQTCTSNSRNIVPAVNHTCCFSCACDEYCWDRGNCCPDVEHPFKAQTVACKNSKASFNYFVVDTCPENRATVAAIICGLETDPRQITEAVYVSDANNTRVFRNRYCAECNDITDYNDWTLGKATVDNSLTNGCEEISNGLLGEFETLENCGIISVRHNLEIHNNSVCIVDSELLSPQCPYSTNYDSTLQKLYNLCEKYRIPFYHFGYYRNVFCYLCFELLRGKTIDTISPSCTQHSTSQVMGTRTFGAVPFTMILNIVETKSDVPQRVCESDQVLDTFKDRCLQLSCAFGYSPKNGRCVRTILDTLYIPFRVQIQTNLTSSPGQQYRINYTEAVSLLNAAKVRLKSIISCPFANEYAWQHGDNEDVGWLIWQLDIYTSTECQDEEIAFFINELKESGVVVKPDNVSSTTHVLTPIWYGFFIEIDRFTVLYIDNNLNFQSEVISVTTATFCKSIILSETMEANLRYDILNAEEDGLLGVLRENIAVADGTFKLCFDVYEDIMRKIQLKHDTSPVGSFSGYLSLVCTILSITCSLFTVTVSLIFDKAHSLPKYILQMVCINLTLAQIVFQFGVGAKVPRPLCVTIGVIIHYLWISHALAMSAFVFGVVIKIRRGISNSSLSYAKVIYHILYIYGTPLIFIILNITVSRLGSADTNIGYGEDVNRLCYISSSRNRILFFSVPIFVIVFLNIAAYVFFVWLMVKARANSELLRIQRYYIRAYARLSCVTGVTWLFGLTSEFIPYAVFEYIFIISNCGQGVVIFFAFGRIKNVYHSIKARSLVSNLSTID